MKKLDELFPIGLAFHGHKCPAMPMGLRAGLAAMRTLGVERAQDKELLLESETGKGHAAACFLDGLMTATGCTYGKANVRKLYYNKLAFTLIDARTGRAVRVAVKPDFFEKALASPFVQQRKAGVPPQEIPAEIADPLVERILGLPEAEFLEVGEVRTVEVPKGKGVFEARRCAGCGELTFVNKLRVGTDGELYCIPCSGYPD
ncbi:formylmethanofuran dehydrogenase [Dissulfurirhabdus thermomarina]|uniref:Formylmethanofuran dehydrogenase n=1 Tax=Dissulfurirhabdus thermomarina TaxID=1765737 RepID=A0A6N9TNW6_DISTH|nr:FmdE family protein [Dissulfurirhabdus thermomarina]NDY42981.1 formylmethanofuran dehydrogenase [Dissulfurirhabdus thermomarina]NMX23798.1 formylmethanofuran dehydrogenase [Dissulfurirhabdus thermomarina]